MCPILKRLPSKQQPFHEVMEIIEMILESMQGEDIRILQHLLSYAEDQFGEELPGIGYRENLFGDRMSNWIVEIDIFNVIITTVVNLYSKNTSLSVVVHDDMIFSYLERSLSLLNPWLIHLERDAGNEIRSFTDFQMNQLLQRLHHMEKDLATIAMNRDQFDIAEGHCQRCFDYSQRYGLEGGQKTDMIFQAFRNYSNLREKKGDCSGALSFAEECYNLVAEAYDPVHSQVQEAAGILIRILIRKGDLFDAQRYAQQTYENLKDKKNGINQKSAELATGAYNLADVIYQQKGDLIKAEELGRESIRIGTLIFDDSHHSVGQSYYLLAGILREQGKLGDETKDLFERGLAISIRNVGPEGSNTAFGHFNLGRYHHKIAKLQNAVDLVKKQLLLAKSYYKEALRIRLKIYGPTHPDTVNVESLLATVLRAL
jgi:tetratricopeptide (TPR) repeat protein